MAATKIALYKIMGVRRRRLETREHCDDGDARLIYIIMYTPSRAPRRVCNDDDKLWRATIGVGRGGGEVQKKRKIKSRGGGNTGAGETDKQRLAERHTPRCRILSVNEY